MQDWQHPSRLYGFPAKALSSPVMKLLVRPHVKLLLWQGGFSKRIADI